MHRCLENVPFPSKMQWANAPNAKCSKYSVLTENGFESISLPPPFMASFPMAEKTFELRRISTVRHIGSFLYKATNSWLAVSCLLLRCRPHHQQLSSDSQWLPACRRHLLIGVRNLLLYRCLLFTLLLFQCAHFNTSKTYQNTHFD